eukprot:TRINITY_DN3467_c0_g1::TRINITY_DN3467_c0_g1_i1::g.20540::m.20540 TRINITY_DN3467_c0_g1::TRINITY_DN3467_c0_g1_i1::g.20540  ORF type:complete len:133 (+),score=-0.97,sp/O94703/RPA12_SCHPO/45.13/9e-23,TFIIS_C/PF01096.13/4.6e+02,TFIIS_C/PF01096.13/2.7e+02,TFIIS_C/PF01096.13/6.7e-17,DZR/PF12773.2/0.0039,DZR/PF12773.2/0.014,DZR/PF12773.2/13,UPF0547/PF10571.4/8.9,UPF0547/PF10571.4/0.3,UPF0547/PF10571.4/0.89,UPF0547/PF10571.4/2.9e+02,zf-ribbon_3/PF13248.1/1.6,zf-ribbon_3/PF13248.1/0.0016,zf-ribbon_3/PF132
MASVSELVYGADAAANLASRFCERCGSLLDSTDVIGSHRFCSRCGFKFSSEGSIVITTKGKVRPNPFEDKAEEVSKERATVKEVCPKCGHGRMAFHTAQLRSADEGQTVFYECLKCQYKFSLNS